jgi:hypothetical protein
VSLRQQPIAPPAHGRLTRHHPATRRAPPKRPRGRRRLPTTNQTSSQGMWKDNTPSRPGRRACPLPRHGSPMRGRQRPPAPRGQARLRASARHRAAGRSQSQIPAGAPHLQLARPEMPAGARVPAAAYPPPRPGARTTRALCRQEHGQAALDRATAAPTTCRNVAALHGTPITARSGAPRRSAVLRHLKDAMLPTGAPCRREAKAISLQPRGRARTAIWPSHQRGPKPRPRQLQR